MQPPAEHVHWLFATGFLLLGLLPARRGDRRARRSGARRAWRAYLLARARVRARRLHVAGDDLLHQLGDPHARARRVGSGADGCAALPSSALVRGKLHSRWWRLRARRVPRLGHGVPRARAEPGSSSARRSCTTCSAGRSSSAALFPLGRVFGHARSVCGDRLRAHVRRRGRDALLRSRRRADLRAISPLAGAPHR